MYYQIITPIESFLNTEGIITYKIKGKSMEPMLRSNIDLVTIQKLTPYDILYENDVVLYKHNNLLILHRIVEINKNNEYTILGDNCSLKEYCIKKNQIIGRLTSFTRNGLHYTMNTPAYLNYIERLRNLQEKRIIRTRIYDVIIWYIRFLPFKLLINIKRILRKLILINFFFEK